MDRTLVLLLYIDETALPLNARSMKFDGNGEEGPSLWITLMESFPRLSHVLFASCQIIA